VVFTKLQVPIRGPLVRAKSRSSVNSMDFVIVKMAAFASERNPRRWRALRNFVAVLLRWQFVQSRALLLKAHNKSSLMTWYDGELESRLHAASVRNPFVNPEHHRFVQAKHELDPCNLFSNEFSDRICQARDDRPERALLAASFSNQE
jgi:hypothetical protein